MTDSHKLKLTFGHVDVFLFLFHVECIQSECVIEFSVLFIGKKHISAQKQSTFYVYIYLHRINFENVSQCVKYGMCVPFKMSFCENGTKSKRSNKTQITTLKRIDRGRETHYN